MAIIKVTGLLYTEDLDLDQVDLSHKFGLSTKGYEDQCSAIPLDDIEFELLGD
jgi:hypothetical protein